MLVYLGSDHGGFAHKQLLLTELPAEGVSATDCGTYSAESTDYPDFALAVAKAVVDHPGSMGILLCRSGEGMDMAANKVAGIRAALVWRTDVAVETRRDNDANVLVLPSDFITDQESLSICRAFLATPFSNEERHVRRIEKIQNIEKRNYAS